MTQPLRAVHRRAFVALALLLPTILLIGLGARRPGLDSNTHPIDVSGTSNIVRDWSNLWQKHVIRSTFYSKPDRPQGIYLVLQPAQGLNEPDLLLYWVTNVPEGNVLPAGAQFVGAFAAGKAFLLPLQEKRAGTLILFSRAHQTVFDTAGVENLP